MGQSPEYAIRREQHSGSYLCYEDAAPTPRFEYKKVFDSRISEAGVAPPLDSGMGSKNRISHTKRERGSEGGCESVKCRRTCQLPLIDLREEKWEESGLWGRLEEANCFQ